MTTTETGRERKDVSLIEEQVMTVARIDSETDLLDAPQDSIETSAFRFADEEKENDVHFVAKGDDEDDDDDDDDDDEDDDDFEDEDEDDEFEEEDLDDDDQDDDDL